MINNTIAFNLGRGSAVFAETILETSLLANNVLLSEGDAPVLECTGEVDPALIRFNDVVAAGAGPAYGGVCTDQTGLNGNVAVNPSFVNASAGDYHLNADSPLIDAGTNDQAPVHDFDGQGRPADGNGDGVATPDIGADEVPTPPLIVMTNTRLDRDHAGPIVIGGDNISLDCRGHTVSGAGGMGISLEGRQGVTIRNCTVTGFDVGFGLIAAATIPLATCPPPTARVTFSRTRTTTD